MRDFTVEELNIIESYLVGSCKTLANALEEIFAIDEHDLSPQACMDIDDRMFSCSLCSWWHNVDELSDVADDRVCEDCNGSSENIVGA